MMKYFLTLEGLSKHRRVFMGISIVCIMLCHNTLSVPQSLETVRKVLSSALQCGVDAFMLLSGLGLVYSFRRNSNIKDFWKKRSTKILPPYLIVITLYGVAYVGLGKGEALSEYIWKGSLISFFWEGELRFWFIAAILALYAVFPMLYKVMQKNPKVLMAATFGVVLISLGIPFLRCSPTIQILNEIFFSRIPAFFAGMIIAKGLLDQKTPKISSVPVWLVWTVTFLLILWHLAFGTRNVWVRVRLQFLPFTLSGMLLLGESMKNCGKNNFFYSIFSFLGGITLELYLLHERVLTILSFLWKRFLPALNFPASVSSLIVNILAILLSVLGAWMLQKTVCLIHGMLQKTAGKQCV